MNSRHLRQLFLYLAVLVLVIGLLVLLVSRASASGMDEVNYWRSRNGLPQLIEDPALTQFAQMKAEYRAQRMLKNGHQGPRWPAGTTEGTGEATADWGWLTCIMEGAGTHAGAGVAIGPDGERYMVLVIRGNAPSLISPHNIRTIPTAHLTPNPPRFGRVIRRTYYRSSSTSTRSWFVGRTTQPRTDFVGDNSTAPVQRNFAMGSLRRRPIAAPDPRWPSPSYSFSSGSACLVGGT